MSGLDGLGWPTNDNKQATGGDCPYATCCRVDSLPEVPFHELPIEGKVTLYDGLGCMIPSGAMLEVWRIECQEGFQIRIRRPLDDGRQSVLRFGLSREAALALHGLLDQQIYPDNAEVWDGDAQAGTRQKTSSPFPSPSCSPLPESPKDIPHGKL